jgi:hypothetical protein
MTLKLYRHVADEPIPAECHDRLIKVLELEKMNAKRSGAPSRDEPNKT